MKFGVLIQEGARDWQIYQQQNGAADIPVGGVWHYEGKPEPNDVWAGLEMHCTGEVRILVRLMEERTNRCVRNWTEAEKTGERSWHYVFGAVPAGELYRIETALMLRQESGGEIHVRGDLVFHVGVGDVFLIAGQSNAVGYGEGLANDPPEVGVHMLRSNGCWTLASHPFSDSTDSLHPVNTEIGGGHTSPWLTFGRELQRMRHRPIGFIPCALGGSALDSWLPGGTLFENMKEVVRLSGTVPCGMLWYQGCNDANEVSGPTYFERFCRFVPAVREALGTPELPILTMQLNHALVHGDDGQDRGWGLVREAQRRAATELPGVYVLSTLNLPLSDAVHNCASSNVVIGMRAAQLAESVRLGRGDGFCPNLAQAVYGRRSGELSLRFDHAPGGMGTIDGVFEPGTFTVTDAAGEIPVDSVTPTGAELRLALGRVPEGELCVSGMWRMDAMQNAPMDMLTRLPMLAFYRVKATEEA